MNSAALVWKEIQNTCICETLAEKQNCLQVFCNNLMCLLHQIIIDCVKSTKNYDDYLCKIASIQTDVIKLAKNTSIFLHKIKYILKIKSAANELLLKITADSR